MKAETRKAWTEAVEKRNARPEPRKAPPPPYERDELKSCLEYLQKHPRVAFAFRANSGAMQLDDRFVKFGFTGCSDIIGMLKTGRFLAFEVKRRGKEPTPDQLAFLDIVRMNGGLAGWGTIDDCILLMNLGR